MLIPYLRVAALICGAAVTAAVPSMAYAQAEGPQIVRVIARAQVRGHDTTAPALQPNAVKVQLDGKDVPVTSVRPLLEGNARPVELAVLIDDGLRGMFNTNLPELDQFVRSTAGPNVLISVGYMRNGGVQFGAPFTNDPDVLAKEIHIPSQMRGIEGSAYFCLSWLAHHWPTTTGNPRVVLMITNGIDYYNGSVSPMNQNSPYVETAINDAQRARIAVYSIYFGGRMVNGTYSSLSGQSYLSNVAEGTGGDEFNNGTITPPSIQPFLNDFRKDLGLSYVIEFQGSGKRLVRLKVTSAANGVKLKAPTAVDPSQM